MGAIIDGIKTGINNWVTGGSWRQSGAEVARQNFEASEAQKSRDFNALEAQKSRDWQEYMSNTSYQRAMNDMQAAGINPAMAFSNGGQGASSSAGASASSNTTARASAGGMYRSNDLGGVLNGAASIASSFNNDKNKANDIDKKQLVSMAIKLATLLG